MTTTYLSQAALEQLNHAQAELDRHLAAGIDGRCVACRQPEPCPARSAAEATFATYGRLPRRRPGLTYAAPASSATRIAWFATTASTSQ